MAQQLIFRQERRQLFPIEPLEGVSFLLACAFQVGLKLFAALRMRFGLGGALKKLARVSAPRRMYYCILVDGRIVSDGDVTFSSCRYYRVDNGAAVIGPVWTAAEARGKGYATYALRSAINALICRGIGVFYIDTAENNISMRRVIAKCEFGEPAGQFEKRE